MSEPTSQALVVGPAWVGDMVMAHTLVQLLATRHAAIDMAAPAATRALAERMPEIRSTHALDFAHGELGLAGRRRAGHALRELGYAEVYVLPNSWKSALVPYFARIPHRVGWRGEARFGLLNRHRALDKAAYPLMIERFMALADPDFGLPPRPYPHPRLSVDVQNQTRLLTELGLEPGPTLALCPGAEFGAAKKWPAAHYAAVAQAALDKGRAVWLLGSPNDQATCAEVAAQAPGAINLAGKTRLLDALDLLGTVEAVVCNDSGLMHVACALGVKTIGIYGSTSPDFTPPLGEQAKVVRLADSLPCQPCFKRECPLKHMNCLNQLSPDTVLAELDL